MGMDCAIKNAGVGVDVGGSFAKVVFIRPKEPVSLPSYVMKEATSLQLKSEFHLSINSDRLGGMIRFIKLPIGKVQAFSNFVKESGVASLFGLHENNKLHITGGGAYKFESVIKERLGISFHKLGEMQMLVDGLNFVLNHVENEVFTYSHKTRQQEFIRPTSPSQKAGDRFPYILVNIGSGVSILKVTSETEFERISGSSVGGGTFWGLLRLMTQVKTWDEVQSMSAFGDNRQVDLLVGDIYGTGYDKLGLDASVIASSFGKVGTRFDPNDATFKPTFFDQPDDPNEDGTFMEKAASCDTASIVRSLLFMISNNIGQVSYLNAKLHQVKRVYFAGGFIQGNPFVWYRLSYAIQFWSKGDMQAMFLVHDGYLGALGALIAQDE